MDLLICHITHLVWDTQDLCKHVRSRSVTRIGKLYSLKGTSQPLRQKTTALDPPTHRMPGGIPTVVFEITGYQSRLNTNSVNNPACPKAPSLFGAIKSERCLQVAPFMVQDQDATLSSIWKSCTSARKIVFQYR